MIDITDDNSLKQAWDELPANAQEVLYHLCIYGPIWDGDLVSKSGRDELLDRKLATKIVMGKGWMPVKDEAGRILEPKRQCKAAESGFQAATYLGAQVYRSSLTSSIMARLHESG